jgi:Bacterial SH3 domain
MPRQLWLARLVGLMALLFAVLGSGPPVALATPAPAADIKAILMAALTKTALAPAYQLELTMSIKGMPPEAAALFGNPAPGQEVSLVDLAGKRRGKDMHITLKGALMTFFGLDPAARLELIEAGGKSYVHGPAPMFGATEHKWYVIDGPPSSESFMKSLQSGVNQTFDYNSLKTIDLSFFTILGKQALHGQQCEVYGSTDKNAIVKALKSAATTAPASDLDQIDTAEIKFWVCDDGYFHQAWVSIDGTTPDRPNEKVGLRIRLSLFDYNGSFTITAPSNPARLEQPQLGGAVFQTLPSSESQSISGPTATVSNGGNIRQKPNVKGQVLGQVHAHQTVGLLEKTVDGRWYHVSAPEATGWVHASLLRVSPDVANRVFVDGEATVAAPASERLTATVVHSGNRRAAPNVNGEVLGQVHAGDTIQLLARTRNGAWYYAICRCGARGWVHASLLKVDPKVARKVPMA